MHSIIKFCLLKYSKTKSSLLHYKVLYYSKVKNKKNSYSNFPSRSHSFPLLGSFMIFYVLLFRKFIIISRSMCMSLYMCVCFLSLDNWWAHLVWKLIPFSYGKFLTSFHTFFPFSILESPVCHISECMN